MPPARDPQDPPSAAGERPRVQSHTMLVPAADYIVYAMAVRERLDPSAAARAGGYLRKRVAETADIYGSWTQVGVPVPTECCPGTETRNTEVVLLVDVLQHAGPALARHRRRQEARWRDLPLPKPYVHGLQTILRTYDMFMRDPFAVESMLEIEDFREAFEQFLKDFAGVVDRTALGLRVSQAVAMLERAFLHRFRAGFRMSELTDYSSEYKGALLRPLTAIHSTIKAALLGSVHCADVPPDERESFRTGGLAVLVAEPTPRVLSMTAPRVRCMGVMLGVLAILRPETLTDLFHEGGHLLRYHETWRDWKDTEGAERIRQVYRRRLGQGQVAQPDDVERIAFLYQSYGEECAAEMFRFAFGCGCDWELYERVFLASHHALFLGSFKPVPKAHRVQVGRSEPLVDKTLAMLADTCARLLCLEAVCRNGGPPDADAVSGEQIRRTLRRVAPFCPELHRAMAALDRKHPDSERLLEYIAHRFRMTYDILAPTLKQTWRRVSAAFGEVRAPYRPEEMAAYKRALPRGQTVVGPEGDPFFPAAMHAATLHLSYSELSQDCVFLPRREVLGGIDFDRLQRAGGAGKGTFLDRKLGSFFYATPRARARAFRRRAALIASLWDHGVRAKQQRLLDFVDRVAESSAQAEDDPAG